MHPGSTPTEHWRYADVAPPLVEPHVMAVSDNPGSSDVGADIMRRGGNAIDAIVAVAFAQAVVNPAAGNLGGGGFLVYRQHDGEVFALDFREAAPLTATRDMYVDSTGKVGDGSILGARAGGVPGSVAGLWAMHKRFGRLPWRDVVTPAAVLAKAHVLDSLRADWLAGNANTFALFPSSAAIFLRADGRPWQAGDTLYQPDLARTLTHIADSGADVFYRGSVAATIATQVQLGGGLIIARRPRPLPGPLAHAARDDLPRLARDHHAARLRRRDHPDPGTQHPGGLRAPGGGNGRTGAPGNRGAPPRVPRPQQPAGRSRLREHADRGAHVETVRHRRSAARSRPTAPRRLPGRRSPRAGTPRTSRW